MSAPLSYSKYREYAQEHPVVRLLELRNIYEYTMKHGNVDNVKSIFLLPPMKTNFTYDTNSRLPISVSYTDFVA